MKCVSKDGRNLKTKKLPMLFELLREQMPSVEKLIQEIVEPYCLTQKSVKSNFSALLSEIHGKVYLKYLEYESAIGNTLISGKTFPELNKFFMSLAQSRKARAGSSFEGLIRILFRNLDYAFDEQIVINGKPDFLLPGEEHYKKDPMDCIIFTAKQTIRERWRQIVTEGVKGSGFFLATLDKTVSEAQLKEMRNHRIYLVVPRQVKDAENKYLASPTVMSFERFFKDWLDPAMVRWIERSVIKKGA